MAPIISATSAVLLLAPLSVQSFSTQSAFISKTSSPCVYNKLSSRCQTPLQMSPLDPHTVTTLTDMIHSSSLLIADAADATADAAATAVKDDGWWQQYLGYFKGALVAVHSTIDQPLRSIGVTQTWGPSIALFTFGVRSLLLPLSFQQTKSTEYTKALKPYQDEIKKKFKDNQDMQNRAVAKLFEDAGTNPLSGCLVSLAQLPIFLALYRSVTLLAKDGALNEPFLWIPSLQGPVSPPLYRGSEWISEGWVFDGSSLPIPQLGWETTLAYLVMPVLLVLGQSLTMSVLTPQPDTSNQTAEEKEQLESSQRILKFLPLLIGFFSLQVPAGLTVYWFTSNLFSVSQSLGVRKYYELNPPKIELPDYWDALGSDEDFMSPEDKRKAAQAGLATGPKFEDLLDEARFHFVVDRSPIREESDAWKRVSSSKHELPAEMAAWASVEAKVEETANV